MKYTILAVKDGVADPDFIEPAAGSDLIIGTLEAARIVIDNSDGEGFATPVPEGHKLVVIDDNGQIYEDVTGDGSLVWVGDSPYPTPDWSPFEGYEAGAWKEPEVMPAALPVNPDSVVQPETSNGHKAFLGTFEYFLIETGELYRAPLANPLGVDGYRQGGRFESTASMAERALAHARVVFAPELNEGELQPSSSRVLDPTTANKIHELFGPESFMHRNWTPEQLIHQFQNYCNDEPHYTLGFFLGMHFAMEQGADLLGDEGLKWLREQLGLHWTLATEIPVEGERVNR